MNSKKNICSLALCMSIMAVGYADTKDSLGLPGDNLDLSGVMELFKKSENPEAFETALNKEDSKVNNLDLNGDGETDYIRVVDRSEGEAHALVLQVPVNETESQDVAVIEIEKGDNETAKAQIVGDEDLYGRDYIVEPTTEEVESASPQAPSQQPLTASVPPPPVVVNVYTWPSVRYIYGPQYRIWVSPWKWRLYPVWWKPWKPVRWHVYHAYVHPYHVYHHRVYAHSVVHAHTVYYGHRVVSKTVYQRRAPMAGPARSVRQEKRIHKQMAPRGPRPAKQARVRKGARR